MVGPDSSSSIGDYAEIRCELDDAILTITLNRPDQLNACTPRMRDELIAAFDVADRTDAVRAVVLTGSGRAFCAGKDLSAGAATFDYAATGVTSGDQVPRDNGGQIALRIWRCLKPVIVAVNGPAVGIGASITLPADVRLIAEGARYGFVFTRRGITLDGAASWFLPRLVGISQAARWVYGGGLVSAKEVVAAGLALGPYPPEDLREAARQIAIEMTEQSSPTGVAAARQLLWRGLGAPDPIESHVLESRVIFELGRRADAYEGVQSFLERREPRFTDPVGPVLDWLAADAPHWATELRSDINGS